mmetsp:Transcript_18242/g.64120  ORF Transcript_18242/g.64120 Transcript_18242/m.64120 type:complete len:92 (+) Transcript_18242:844-1119(+)
MNNVARPRMLSRNRKMLDLTPEGCRHGHWRTLISTHAALAKVDASLRTWRLLEFPKAENLPPEFGPRTFPNLRKVKNATTVLRVFSPWDQF